MTLTHKKITKNISKKMRTEKVVRRYINSARFSNGKIMSANSYRHYRGTDSTQCSSIPFSKHLANKYRFFRNNYIIIPNT